MTIEEESRLSEEVSASIREAEKRLISCPICGNKCGFAQLGSNAYVRCEVCGTRSKNFSLNMQRDIRVFRFMLSDMIELWNRRTNYSDKDWEFIRQGNGSRLE